MVANSKDKSRDGPLYFRGYPPPQKWGWQLPKKFLHKYKGPKKYCAKQVPQKNIWSKWERNRHLAASQGEHKPVLLILQQSATWLCPYLKT